MRSTISITSDFGDQFASSQLRAVAYSLDSNINLIENHSVSPFNIREGAFEMWQISKFCPCTAIHVGVVDPGVGSERSGIAIRSNNFWWIGPDNGLLYPGAVRDGLIEAWKLYEDKISDEVSNTFHGRDVFIKAAVGLSRGENVGLFASRLNVDNLAKIEFVENEIVHIDRYGNIKIWHAGNGLKLGNIVTINKDVTATLVKTYSDVEPGKWLIYRGSHGILEVAMNQRNAASRLNVRPGDKLELEYYHDE